MRNRRDGERGAATTEALIILPFFFIVWGALFFSHRLSEKKVVVNEIARTCAWQLMTGGCQEAQSPRCSFNNATTQLSDDELEGSRASLENYHRRILGADGPIGFEYDFRGTFGPYFRETFGAEREATVPKPRQIGGGEFNVDTEFSEMCNETVHDETVPTESELIFCTISPWC
jgi:hypothetical protein